MARVSLRVLGLAMVVACFPTSTRAGDTEGDAFLEATDVHHGWTSGLVRQAKVCSPSPLTVADTLAPHPTSVRGET
jgi:hypothetical protein